MIDYQRGKIYKMETPSGLKYIGSTCQPTLARRLAKHKDSYKYWKGNGDKTSYMTSFKLFDETLDNVTITLIESYPCNNVDELHMREGFWIKQFTCVNKNQAGRSMEQWRKDNAEYILQYSENYRAENADKIQKSRESNKDWMHTYYTNNKEKILARKEERKDEIQKKHLLWNTICLCLCGKTYTKAKKSRHLKSKHHIQFIDKK